MHKSFIISEEDKTRILGMHQNATKRQYLNEATETSLYQQSFPKETPLPGVNKIISSTIQLGTDNNLLLKGFQEITNYPKTEEQLKKYWNSASTVYRYDSIQDMLRGEMDKDGESTQVMSKINDTFKKFGIQFTFEKNNDGSLKPNTIKQVLLQQYKTEVKPTAPACLKGGRWSDKNKVWWMKLADGEYAFSQDGSYRKEGSENKGYYKCENGVIKYSRTPFTKTTSTSESLPVPAELKGPNAIVNFQTWMENNIKGWYVGNKPIDGIFGKQTSKAWETYKNEYLKSLGKENFKFKPQSPSTEQPDDVSQGIDQGKQ